MTDLTGRWCLITGATGGFGRQLAAAFAEAGAHLVLAGRRAEALEEVVTSLPARDGQRCEPVVVDLAAPDGAQTLAAATRGICSRLDVLINNAATQGAIGPAWEVDPASWARTIQINLVAPATLCAQLAPFMSADGRRGKIVNLSGGGATGPRPNFSAYAASKAALVRLTETLAIELAAKNIDVNAVAPGRLVTAMTEEVLAAGPERAGRGEYDAAAAASGDGGDMGRGDMGRAGALCLFLASSASDGITGRLISAVWDPWTDLPRRVGDLVASDVYTLRRIVPADRGLNWT